MGDHHHFLHGELFFSPSFYHMCNIFVPILNNEQGVPPICAFAPPPMSCHYLFTFSLWLFFWFLFFFPPDPPSVSVDGTRGCPRGLLRGVRNSEFSGTSRGWFPFACCWREAVLCTLFNKSVLPWRVQVQSWNADLHWEWESLLFCHPGWDSGEKQK